MGCQVPVLLEQLRDNNQRWSLVVLYPNDNLTKSIHGTRSPFNQLLYYSWDFRSKTWMAEEIHTQTHCGLPPPTRHTWWEFKELALGVGGLVRRSFGSTCSRRGDRETTGGGSAAEGERDVLQSGGAPKREGESRERRESPTQHMVLVNKCYSNNNNH